VLERLRKSEGTSIGETSEVSKARSTADFGSLNDNTSKASPLQNLSKILKAKKIPLSQAKRDKKNIVS